MKAAALLTLVVCGLALPATAGAGALDKSFGHNGFAYKTYGTGGARVTPVGLTRSPEGRFIVFAGVNQDLGVFVYRPDGSLDPGYHGRGFRLFELINGDGANYDKPGAVVRQSAGKTIVAGGEPRRPAYGASGSQTISRFTDDGELDPGFGRQGTVVVPGLTPAIDAAVDSAGRIVALSSTETALRVTRYGRNGKLDRSFGKRGTVSRSVGPGSNGVSLTVDRNRGIVIAGTDLYAKDHDPRFEYRLFRLRENGSPDKSFGKGGRVEIPPFRFQPLDVVALPSGKLLVLGERPGKGDDDFIRYLADGRVDQNFGDHGIVPTGERWTQGSTQLTVLSNDRLAAVLDHQLNLFEPDGSALEVPRKDLPMRGGGALLDGPAGSVINATLGNSPLLGKLNPDLSVDTALTEAGEPQQEVDVSLEGGMDTLTKLNDGSLFAGKISGVYEGFGISRFSQSGRPDLSFGKNGDRYTSELDGGYPLTSVAVGKGAWIVGPQVQTSHSRRLVVGPTGNLGKQLLEGFGNQEVADMLPMKHGRVLVAGGIQKSNGRNNFPTGGMRIGLLKADGTPVKSFGKKGFTNLFPKLPAVISSVALDRKGRIVAVGGDCDTWLTCVDKHDVTQKVTVARFLPNGDVDRSFGRHGYVQYTFGKISSADSVAIRRDGTIITTIYRSRYHGYSNDGAQSLLALNGNGSIDRSFGRGGEAKIKVGSGPYVIDLYAGRGNSIDAPLSVDDCQGRGRFAIASVNRSGKLDRHFGGGDGVLASNAPREVDSDTQVSVKQSRGTITLGGYSSILGPLGGVEGASGLARFNLKGRDGKHSLGRCRG